MPRKAVPTIALIGCSKRKLGHSAPARELYQGTLFKYSVRYVEQVLGIKWAVLSTKYGLVFPEEVIEPYSCSFSSNPAAYLGETGARVTDKVVVRDWEKTTRVQLDRAFPRPRVFVALASAGYLGCLRGLDYSTPLGSMRLGPRIAWLRKQLSDNGVL
jgi:hypothetical protein